MDWKKLEWLRYRGVASVWGKEGQFVRRNSLHWQSLCGMVEARNTGRLGVAVGVSSRISGYMLSDAIIEDMRIRAQCSPLRPCLPPAMFMITIDSKRPCSAGIMITASHLPLIVMGLSFHTEGGLEKADISEILEIAGV